MGSRAQLAVLVAIVMSIAVGCGGDDAGVEIPPAVTFDGSSWVMERGILDDVQFGPIVDGLLTFTDVSVTEIGCEPALMDVETAMLAVLAMVDRFDLDRNQLTLANGDGTAQLVMTAWSPTASNGSTPGPTGS